MGICKGIGKLYDKLPKWGKNTVIGTTALLTLGVRLWAYNLFTSKEPENGNYKGLAARVFEEGKESAQITAGPDNKLYEKVRSVKLPDHKILVLMLEQVKMVKECLLLNTIKLLQAKTQLAHTAPP